MLAAAVGRERAEGSTAMRWMLAGGALLGALAVASGAFGAHALQGVLSERARIWYDTAVTYHARHALALLACGLLSGHALAPHGAGAPSAPAVTALGVAAFAFVGGIALFSGSLYVMAFTGWTRLGIVTPLGGLALVVGWIALAVAAVRLPLGVS